MSKTIKLMPLMLLCALLAGCTSTITNLAPSKQVRNASGLYPIEAEWDTREQTVRPTSLKPSVVVEFQSYPMRPTLGMKNRWETVIPGPAGKNVVPYHIRFDYEYNAFGKPQKGSRLSPGYKLEILDK